MLNRIKWLYHSRSRANLNVGMSRVKKSILSIADVDIGTDKKAEDVFDIPSYDALVNQLAKKLEVFEDDASLETLEESISHEVIVRALQKMSPKERRTFFSNAVDYSALNIKLDSGSTRLRGPVTTMAAIGAAKASGFGLYMASTTALGFMTQAAGITLPFAAYTGLTSTIAYIIGPAGWLAAGGWLFWNITGPEWEALTRVVLFIISRKSQLL